jgi:hypothetical protein
MMENSHKKIKEIYLILEMKEKVKIHPKQENLVLVSEVSIISQVIFL